VQGFGLAMTTWGVKIFNAFVLFQHLVIFSSAFGRRTFAPRPLDRVFTCDLNREQNSLQSFFAGFDLNSQHVLFRWESADKFLVVGTGGMIGHIEV